jgi:hypothetical protein
MPTVLFRGAKLKHFHGVIHEGVRLCRAKFEADYTDKLREDVGLDWKALPDTSDKMNLRGSLLGCENFIMTAGGGLSHEINVAAVSAQKFEAVRVKQKDKEATVDVIRFEILCNDSTCVQLIDAYAMEAGEVAGTLKLKYSESKGKGKKGNTDQMSLVPPAEEGVTDEDVKEPKKRRTKASVQ